MERLTERDQVRTVAARWREQYPKGSSHPKAAPVYHALSALDTEAATAADVHAIIGNWSWVRAHACDECGAEKWDAVQVGQAPDYDSSTCVLCVDCLRRALALTTPTPEAHDADS